MSSILLFIGVGSFVCYQLVINNKKKHKKKEKPKENTEFFLKIQKKNQEFSSQNINLSNKILRKDKKFFTSTPFCYAKEKLTPSIISSTDSIENENVTDFTDNYIDTENSIMETPTSPGIGDGTVAKFDKLLMQIQDIKQSVVEIDAELFEVTGAKSGFDANLFRLAPITPSYSFQSDFTDHFHIINNESQTPSLEWDLNDINLTNFDGPIETNSILSQEPNISQNYSKCNRLKITPLNLTDTTTSSSSTSGNVSVMASPEEKERVLQDLIGEAKKLGILNELIDVLVENNRNKRDSAFCED